jgi:hypothetical protein
MDYFAALHTFVRSADLGSFSKAGRLTPTSLAGANDEAGSGAHRVAAPPPSPPHPASLSSTMLAFSDDAQRRCRSGPERTVTGAMCAR